MENNPLLDNLDPIQFAKIVGDIVTEDAPVPEGWKHNRFILEDTSEQDEKA
jgi:hypothetical protein